MKVVPLRFSAVVAVLALHFFAEMSPARAACPACDAFGSGISWGAVSFNGLSEASGLAASRRNFGVLWTHNDGSGENIYALSTNGARLATFDFSKSVDDTEDIAVGPGPLSGLSYLYLGDIGGNQGSSTVRSEIKIVRMPEPVVDLAWAGNPRSPNFDDVETFTLLYPDGSHDAETLMVDPISGDVFVATKQEVGARLYRVNLMALPNQSTVTMEFVRTVSFDLASGGDISAEGTQIVLRREDSAMSWGRCINESIGAALAGAGRSIPVIGPPNEPNGESIALLPDGTGYVTISEGQGPVVYFFPAQCPAAPRFTLAPQDQSSLVNGSAEFRAVAVGYPPPSYQWSFNGQPLTGQTNAMLVLLNIGPNQAGAYQVSASNESGRVTDVATLTVRFKPDLRITEVMSSEASSQGVNTADWWELTSFEAQAVDLSGWRFNDSGGGLADAYIFPAALFINPGESIVFSEGLTAIQFRNWWGAANLPADLRIISYSGNGLSLGADGDGIRLWDAQTADANNTIASVDFGTATAGISFNYNPGTGQFGANSQLGVDGVIQAAMTSDIGSPGRIRGTTPDLFLQVLLVDGQIQIAFDAVRGFRYSLQTQIDLETATWELTGDIIQPSANGPTFFQKENTGSHRFYRVVVE
ncbi:MAG TPA: lamin tail domain-containing protein [Verrucomicrobiae bacterium]|nr:lamin tail domain-containing protein [Verrucomicrobiae bacterium]